MRLIDADALKNIVPKCDMDMHVMDFKGLIDKTPTIDAAPVVCGKWIDDLEIDGLYKCSECGVMEHRYRRPEYCYGCGADMREV